MRRVAIRKWREWRYFSSQNHNQKQVLDAQQFHEKTAKELKMFKSMGLLGLGLMLFSTLYLIFAPDSFSPPVEAIKESPSENSPNSSS
jgi:hypothetical protein